MKQVQSGTPFFTWMNFTRMHRHTHVRPEYEGKAGMGKGFFYATDLDLVLNRRRIRNIVLTGITTDVCVHTTMRDANDRGYECLLLSDCAAATDRRNHEAALSMVQMQGGVFGAVATSAQFLEALG